MSIAGEVNVPALTERVKRILTTPKTEWLVIDAEATTVERLYKSYIIPLAAIPAVAGFIGNSIIGTAGFLGYYRVPIVTGLIMMIVGYVLSLAMCYIAALIVDKLAPTFGSVSNMTRALQLVAYAYTPVWVGGIAAILPMLSMLVMLVAGLYAIYLFYLGIPVMMKTPQDKVIPYMAVSAVVMIVLGFIVGMITAMIVGGAAIATSL